MKRSALILSLAILGLTPAFSLTGCSARTVSPSVQEGATFPSVVGESLQKKEVRIPEDFKGKPTVLLVGYTQRAQFDIDRWILGLLQLETPCQIVEVPTIAGMAPTILQDVISNGMRRGIPEEDWGSVVTVFGDAEKIVAAIGNERQQSAHVVLLDASGRIVATKQEGYSASNVKQIHELVNRLASAPTL